MTSRLCTLAFRFKSVRLKKRTVPLSNGMLDTEIGVGFNIYENYLYCHHRSTNPGHTDMRGLPNLATFNFTACIMAEIENCNFNDFIEISVSLHSTPPAHCLPFTVHSWSGELLQSGFSPCSGTLGGGGDKGRAVTSSGSLVNQARGRPITGSRRCCLVNTPG